VTRFKNTEPYGLPVGGRMLAPSEIANLDPNHPDVVLGSDAGHLVRVQSGDPKPAQRQSNRTIEES
jgi:hypothetical protein